MGWLLTRGVSAQGIGGVRGPGGAAQTRTVGPGPERESAEPRKARFFAASEMRAAKNAPKILSN
jgi:hypothetical protein